MSLLIRAALLGGIAYLITRSLSGNASRRTDWAGSGAAPRRELHPGENHVWPTGPDTASRQAESANAGPTS